MNIIPKCGEKWKIDVREKTPCIQILYFLVDVFGFAFAAAGRAGSVFYLIVTVYQRVSGSKRKSKSLKQIISEMIKQEEMKKIEICKSS